MAKTAKRELGDWGEDMAAEFLQKLGYEIVERNYTAKHSDIDIIARHKKPHRRNTLCFIEVKTRTGAEGTAEAATDFKKKKNIFFAAKRYCIDNDIKVERAPIQFEQVSVYVDGEGEVIYKHDIIPVE